MNCCDDGSDLRGFSLFAALFIRPFYSLASIDFQGNKCVFNHHKKMSDGSSVVEKAQNEYFATNKQRRLLP